MTKIKTKIKFKFSLRISSGLNRFMIKIMNSHDLEIQRKSRSNPEAKKGFELSDLIRLYQQLIKV
jgi:hypothetical protein